MNKNKQIIVAVAFPILLASLFILIDYAWFSPAISQNESGISWGLGLYEKPFSLFSENPFFDLGGASFVSELLRLIALCLFLIAPVMPTFIKYLQKPIERTELNLTNKLI
jgi:hypothetical protein